MNSYSLDRILTERSSASVIVTRKMVRERAVELGVAGGHSAEDVSKGNWDQAKREMTSNPNISHHDHGPQLPTTIGQRLSSHPFTKGMTVQSLAVLIGVAREVEFEPGQVVFHQNEHAHRFYLIEQGRVALDFPIARRDSIPVQVVAAGDVLGWSWLFPPFTWHLQASSLEPTKAISLDAAGLLAACEADHGFGYDLMQRVAEVLVNRLEAAQQCLSEAQAPAGPLPFVDEILRQNHLEPQAEQSIQAILADHPFFQGIDPEHLKILAESGIKSKVHAGEVIIREGDPANRFYLIQNGKVVLEAMSRDKAPRPFQLIGDGDVVGWSWLFPPFYSHFEARALEPTTGIILYATRIREACAQNHDLGYALLKRTAALVIERLQATRQRLAEIAEQAEICQ